MDPIEELMTKEINRGSLAGVSILAMKKDKVIYKNSFGYANLETKAPMKSDTIVRLFSMTKTITAAAVMLLLERKQLKLEDKVCSYLPGFCNQKAQENGKIVPVHRDVTIYDLLSMTSGAAYPIGPSIAEKASEEVFNEQIASIQEGKGISTVEFCNRLGKCPLSFMPGERWMYGTSADILAGVVEVVSSMRYGDFLKKEFFEPLGMKDTDFYVPKEKEDRLSEWYEYDNEHKKLIPYRGTYLGMFDYTRRPAWESGGAGLVSTIDDYAKFALMLVQEGIYQGKRILSPETVRYMRTNQLTEQQAGAYSFSGNGCGYGNLVRIMEQPEKMDSIAGVGTYGWDGWTGPLVSIDPANQVIFLFMIQKANAGTVPLSMQVSNLAYKML